MTIEQLYYFYAISVHGTFSKAAIEMHITQSALSKQIAKLEQELGISLFDRSHRQITLSDDGKQILDDVKAILEQYQQLQTHLLSIKSKKEHTIKIAALPIFSQYNLHHLLEEFQKQNPKIDLQIKELEERDVLNSFEKQYDVYILRQDYDFLQNYTKTLIFKDTMVAVVSKKHLLSHESSISLHQLTNTNLLLPPAYTSITKLAIHALNIANIVPKDIQYGRVETILSAVNENHGIALVMKNSLLAFQLSNVQIIPLHEKISGNIYLYTPRQVIQQEALKTFIRYMKNLKQS